MDKQEDNLKVEKESETWIYTRNLNGNWICLENIQSTEKYYLFCLLLMNTLFLQEKLQVCISLYYFFVHSNAEGILPVSYSLVLFMKRSYAFLTSYSLFKVLVNYIKTHSLLPQEAVEQNFQYKSDCEELDSSRLPLQSLTEAMTA